MKNIRLIISSILLFLGIYAIYAGVLGFYGGRIVTIVLGDALFGNLMVFFSLLFIIYGVSCLVAGYGIYKKETYGIYLSIFISGIWLVQSLIQFWLSGGLEIAFSFLALIIANTAVLILALVLKSNKSFK